MFVTSFLIFVIHIITVYGDTCTGCCKEPIANIGSCCKIPTILNPAWLKECIYAKSPPSTTAKPKQKPKKAALTHAVSFLDVLTRPRRQTKQEPHCVLDCVFKKRKFYDSKGNLSPATMAANVASFVSDDWSNIVAAAMADCTDITEAVDFGTTPAPLVKGSSCNYKAEFYMNCINRIMILACPKEGTAKADPKSCPAKVRKVQDCDPMIAADPPPPRSEMTDFDAGNQYLPSLSERVFKDSDVQSMFSADDGEEYDDPLMQRPSAKTTSPPKKSAKKPADAKKSTTKLPSKKQDSKKPAKKV